MIDTLHKTIQRTTVIIDTVKTSSASSLDLINKVDAFYNSAWLKLIGVLTFVGFAVPIYIKYLQDKQLKLSEENLKKEIAADYKKSLEELETKYTESIKRLETETSKMINENSFGIKVSLSKELNLDTHLVYLLVVKAAEALNEHNIEKAITVLKDLIPLIHDANVQHVDRYLWFKRLNFEYLLSKVTEANISDNPIVREHIGKILGDYREYHTPLSYGMDDLGGYSNVYTMV